LDGIQTEAQGVNAAAQLRLVQASYDDEDDYDSQNEDVTDLEAMAVGATEAQPELERTCEAPGQPERERADDETIAERISKTPLLNAMVDLVPFVISADNPQDRQDWINRLQAGKPADVEAFWKLAVSWMKDNYPQYLASLSNCLLPDKPGGPAPLTDGRGHPTKDNSPRFGYGSPELHDVL